MKKTLLTFGLLAMATVSSFAQGSINPLNGAFTRVKIDLNGDGIGDRNATTADGLQFTVLWGASGAANLDKVAGVMTIGTTEGVMVGLPSVLALAGAGEAGSVISLQIQASNDLNWSGRTSVAQVTLAPGSGPGTPVWSSTVGPTKFLPMVVTVPEPSTVALGVLGLGSLLLFRRRK